MFLDIEDLMTFFCYSYKLQTHGCYGNKHGCYGYKQVKHFNPYYLICARFRCPNKVKL